MPRDYGIIKGNEPIGFCVQAALFRDSDCLRVLRELIQWHGGPC